MYPKKYIFLLPLLFLIVTAYWRYTYILNPNLSGDPFIVKIAASGTLSGSAAGTGSVSHAPSIIIYWIFFLIGNAAFFRTFFKSAQKTGIMLALYLLISVVSALFFVVHSLWLSSPLLYNLASVMKNFLLTPMFTAVAYILLVRLR